jgi:hypothetical protein
MVRPRGQGACLGPSMVEFVKYYPPLESHRYEVMMDRELAWAVRWSNCNHDSPPLESHQYKVVDGQAAHQVSFTKQPGIEMILSFQLE